MKDILYYFDRQIDEFSLKETFLAAYGIPLDYKIFEWRFLNNPFEEKVYINYILAGNCLAAYYAVSPVDIELKGVTHKIALSNMTMTHPDHQGKGYFKTLAIDLYKKLKDDGFIGVFGFANQNSHYGFRKNLGWVDLAELCSFSTDKEKLKKAPSSFNDLFNILEEKTEIKHVQATLAMKFSNQVVVPSRSESFLTWRLINNPINQYHTLIIRKSDKLIGILFYKFYNSSIDIMECFFDQSSGIEKHDILHYGFDYLLSKYNFSLNIWSNLHTDEHLFLEKIGFKNSHFVTYFGVIPFAQPDDLKDFTNWHFRFIDSDVF
jgi:GNAT superfamily N-acetyltransferase